MVKRWNEKIPPDGVVYHLGDFSLGSLAHTKNILNALNGEIHLIKGNHDSKNLKFKSVQDYLEIVVNNKLIVLFHYGLRVWNKSHFDSWHLFGHSHGLLENTDQSMDVGVDCHNFYPVSFIEVCERLK